MKLQRCILAFLAVVMISTASHAYLSLRLGYFTGISGDSNFGGGLLFGLPLPVKGLAVEAEAMGYYDDLAIGNAFYLQTNVGPKYDFNPLITPDSDFFHPYLRAGVAYGWLFLSEFPNENGAGFYTGGGIRLNLPVVFVGAEANYNFINFNTAGTDEDFWNIFFTVGIHI